MLVPPDALIFCYEDGELVGWTRSDLTARLWCYEKHPGIRSMGAVPDIYEEEIEGKPEIFTTGYSWRHNSRW